VAELTPMMQKYMETKEEYPDLFSDICVTPHVFRHTTATHMLEAGVPIIVVSRFLGHSDIKTTQVYAKLSERDVNEKLRNWDKAYWGEYMDEPLDPDAVEETTPEERNLAKIFGKKV